MRGLDIHEILTCAGARWSPGIGDPTLYGWATVGVFAVAALLCALLAASPEGRPERALWIALALLMAALAVNKQLDLQSALTAAGRCVSQDQGWYDARRGVQALFTLAVGAASLAGLVLLAVAMRRHLARTWAALLGAGFVAGFVLVRAVSWGHVGAILDLPVGGMRMNHVFENAGPLLVALNALALLWRRPPRRRPDAASPDTRTEAEERAR